MSGLALAERSETAAADAALADTRSLAFLFSDIEGSAALTEQLGDAGMFRLLLEHHALVRRQISGSHGFEAGTTGDGFMVVFDDPADAVRCAVGIQRGLALRNATVGACTPIRVRIGVHAGPALGDLSQFCGRTVVLAARVAAAARGEQILVTGPVLGALPDGLRAGNTRRLALKGLAGRHTLHEICWREDQAEAGVA